MRLHGNTERGTPSSAVSAGTIISSLVSGGTRLLTRRAPTSWTGWVGKASTGPHSAAQWGVQRTWSRTTGTRSTRSWNEEGDRRDSASHQRPCRDPTRLLHIRHSAVRPSRQLIPPPTTTTKEHRPLSPAHSTTNRRRHPTAGLTITLQLLTRCNIHHAALAMPQRWNRLLRWPQTTDLLSNPRGPPLASRILKANSHCQVTRPRANSPTYSRRRNYSRRPSTAAQHPHPPTTPGAPSPPSRRRHTDLMASCLGHGSTRTAILRQSERCIHRLLLPARL